jgi:hypothetical protein
MVANVLRHYPAYRLEDFYHKSFVDGGVTAKQLFFLYRSADDERYEYYRFLGALQGIDIDEKRTGETVNEVKTEERQFLFQDPAVYQNMTEEEKQKETDKMLGHWKSFQLKTSPKEQ